MPEKLEQDPERVWVNTPGGGAWTTHESAKDVCEGKDPGVIFNTKLYWNEHPEKMIKWWIYPLRNVLQEIDPKTMTGRTDLIEALRQLNRGLKRLEIKD